MKRVRNTIETINWTDVQESGRLGLCKKEICEKYSFSMTLLKKAEKMGIISIPKFVLTEDRRKKHADSCRAYWLNNPEKHPWKNHDKFQSKPCNMMKQELRDNNICFLEEFHPLLDRFYSIDIAFPDKKIGIEINGNQHYDSNGKLKKYYQERHDLIESQGWILYEYHYSIVFNKAIIGAIIDRLKQELDLSTIDYSFYIKQRDEGAKSRKRENARDTCKCGEIKYKTGKECRACKNKSMRKVKSRPSKEILLSEIKKIGYSAVGRKYGVSDNAIRKWIK